MKKREVAPRLELVPKNPERVDMNGEHVPDRAEVKKLFDQLIPGTYEEASTVEDDQGLYAWTVRTRGQAADEMNEYEYRRGVGGGTECTVSVTYFEGEMPVGGKTLADCVDGNWVMKN